MKVAVLFLLLGASIALADNVESQTTCVNIQARNVQAKEVIVQIEAQTDYLFVYNNDMVDLSRKVSVAASNAPVAQVLSGMFVGSDVVYAMEGNNILLFRYNGTVSRQQEGKRITGIVLDSGGEPVIGANVIEKGTQNGVISNVDGRFEISVSDNAVLLVSYIGYAGQEIAVGNQSSFNIVLKESALGLEEVVVVGYGVQKKKDLTGSVSQVRGGELKNLPVRSAVDALQGRSAGVMITSTGGSPGTPPAVRIRGIGTINNNDPLYVVDGLPQSGIGWLNPNDIESIDILKDASATAIYGSRAANGVIMISTVKGSEQVNTMINFDAYLGIQNPYKVYNMMNASEFIDYKNLAYTNAGLAPFWSEEQKQQALKFVRSNTGSENGTNWWKEVNNSNAPVQNYNLSISGGTKNLSYLTSLSYMEQEGIMKGPDYNRISWRTNFDHTVKKWLKLSGNIGVIHESRRNVLEGSPGFNTAFIAFVSDPITPVYRTGLKDVPAFIEPSLFLDRIDPGNPYSLYCPVILTNKENVVAQTHIYGGQVWKGITVKGGLSAEFDILPYLKFKTHFAVDISRGGGDSFTPQYYLSGNQYSNDATVYRSAGNTNYWLWENILTLDRTLGEHHVVAMIGTSSEETVYDEFAASKQGLVNNDESQRILNAATKNPGASGYKSESAMASYFARFFYSWRDKYLLTATVRRDGSSNFGPGEKWGVFPSFSAGWNFVNENFMAPTQKWLSYGKLRVSWGQIGNQNISGGAYQTTYSGSIGRYLFGYNYVDQLTGGRNYMGNPNVSWETTQQTDIGLELGFLRGKLNLTIDYFLKQTDGMLLQVPLPGYLGFTNNPWVNAGNVKNSGWEVEIKHQNALGDFNYNAGLNFFTFRNEVVSLGGGEPIFGGTWLNHSTTKTEEGKPIGYFYGLKTDGIFQSQAEVDAYFQEGARPGDLRYVDMNGDGKIDANDRTQIGNPFPKLSFGINLGGEYKGFDLQLLFQGTLGNDVMNIQKIDMKSGVGWYNAPKGLVQEAWSATNPSNTQFRISSDNSTNLQVSDWLVEDASYVRLKNIQLGYSLPKPMLEKATIQRVRFWVGAYNMLTLTKYSGLDPEIGSSSPLNFGVDQGYYPQAISYMLGVNLTF
ncbi:MAG: TonB-dependent receptor [Tannerellaceae bacterium]|jgi:TonB-linked SusC/RagA family outer membrane protein|nr:TonB-dependent receptor [Tannerellaceae bacterium]